MAMILDVFLSKFTGLLVKMVEEEVGILLGIPGQIEKLENTVHDIQCVLADAERRQSKGSAIERWLMQLKDVMYDADEVIDLCQIKAKERSTASSSSSSPNAHYGFHFRSYFRNPVFAHEIGIKIKDINLRLEEIAKSKTNLGLTEAQIFHGTLDQGSRVDSVISRKTHPVVVLADIVGEKIEKDTEMLVNWLTEEESDVNENPHVCAIVGMGGIGKTTLAKKIFNDPKIKEGFELKIWVCVSQEVNENDVLKCMIRGAGGQHGDCKEISELVPLLESLVRGKKFFFVLDDVWEKSRAVLNDWLRASMSSGAHGSMLLVTTRNEDVAKRMKASKLHRVKKLSPEDGWSLLKKQVFQNESESEEFKDIGLQLVEKCDYLPLAIKSIGGVLYMKAKSRGEWQAVLENSVWYKVGLPDEVHRALYLSYEDLSSSLKQCFIFCSLFPEDFEYSKRDIIYMWLAEGFLPNKSDFWNLGIEHYTELVLRNLLEETNIFHVKDFKMHDLLWSFARHLGKHENCVLREVSDAKAVGSQKIRRLSIEGNEVNTGVIKKEKGLRTLLLHGGKPEIGLDDLCKASSNLRILDLKESNFSILPDSLCDLVHLRHLDVKGSRVLSKLPNSIGNLKYLVYLDLSWCLKLSHVPQSIINLQELKFFNILYSSIKKIPAGLKKLDKLVELHGFKPFQNNLEGFSSLDELETLSNLTILILQCLDEVSDVNLAKQAKLLSKDQLRHLTLKYTSLTPEQQLSQTNEKKMIAENVLNELCPPLNVEEVTIENYFGTHLPNWLNSRAYLPNLKFLYILNCACFEEVASLGLLPNLEFLVFIAHSVVNIGDKFLWGGIQSRDTITTTSCSAKPAFPKLRELRFMDMQNWKEWQWNKGQPAMPNLKRLIIRNCPHLRSLPEGLSHHATSLEYLRISGAGNLIIVGNLKVQRMELEKFDMESLPECLKFDMETLPEYLTTIMAQKLEIRGCTERLWSKIASQEETGSERIKFKHIPKVTIRKKTFLSGVLVDSDHN